MIPSYLLHVTLSTMIILILLTVIDVVIVNGVDRLSYVKQLLIELPRGLRAATKQVLHLLSHIHKNSTQTDASYLAEVFGTIYLRPREKLYYMENDDDLIVKILRMLI